jgi:hypothetical protein
MVVGALAGALVMAMAPPAAAETATYADEPGGVTDLDGAPTTDAQADILDITLTNEQSFVEVVVHVAEAADADDAGWTQDRALEVVFLGTTGGEGVIVVPTPDGPLAYVNPGCEVDFDIDTAADTYTLTLGQPCVRAVPATTSPLVVMINGSNVDVGPGDGEAAFDVEPVSSGAATVRRLAGTDRILTAGALSADRFAADGASAVVLASAASFPDALAGGPFAAALGAPILLTPGDTLDARTAGQIDRALVPGGDVFVLGGTAAIGDQVLTAVRARGYEVERIAGSTRFETAVAIADKLGAIMVGEPDASIAEDATASVVVLADGMSFPDALIAGAAAARMGAVLLLTAGNTLPDATRQYLDDAEAVEFTIGTPATTARPGADEQVTGSSPAQLSRRVMEGFGLSAGTVAIASEDTFADALAGGGHIGGLGPLLLTDGKTASDDLVAALEGAVDDLRDVVIYGGTAAISPEVEQAIRSAVG